MGQSSCLRGKSGLTVPDCSHAFALGENVHLHSLVLYEEGAKEAGSRTSSVSLLGVLEIHRFPVGNFLFQ